MHEPLHAQDVVPVSAGVDQVVVAAVRRLIVERGAGLAHHALMGPAVFSIFFQTDFQNSTLAGVGRTAVSVKHRWVCRVRGSCRAGAVAQPRRVGCWRSPGNDVRVDTLSELGTPVGCVSARADVTPSGPGRLCDERNFVRSVARGCIKVPSGAGKTEIPDKGPQPALKLDISGVNTCVSRFCVTSLSEGRRRRPDAPNMIVEERKHGTMDVGTGTYRR